MEKICTSCYISKDLEAFTKQKRGKYGYSSQCRECRNKIRTPYYEVRRFKTEQAEKGLKFCRGCQTWKPLDDFHLAQSGTKGRQSFCKPCANALAKAWRGKNPSYYHFRVARDPEYFRRARLRKLYGLTLESYAELLEEQQNVCAICRQPERCTSQGKLAPLAVDHSHKDGKTRGLLCRDCNTALGYVDRQEWLGAALAYLEKYNGKT